MSPRTNFITQSVVNSIILLIVLLLSTLAHAQWGETADDYIRLPLGSPPNYSSTLCSDGNGGCWAAADPVGLCHIDKDGNLTWGDDPWGLGDVTSYNPKPVLAANGDVILAMDIYNEQLEHPIVYLQRVNHEGELVWDEDGIPIDTSHQFSRRYQGIIGAYAGPVADTYLIHWVRHTGNFENWHHLLQLIDDDGEFLWGDVGKGEDWFSGALKIVISSDQSVIVAHPLAVEEEADMEVHKIDSDGERLWSEKYNMLSQTVRKMRLRDIESDRDGGAILVYEFDSLEDDNHDSRYFGITVMRISSDGDSLWARHVYEREEEYRYEASGNLNPIINYAGSGRFFVAWADWPHTFQVVALDVDGEQFWNEPVDVILTPAGYNRFDAVDSDSNVCYVWRDIDQERQQTQQQFGQRINIDGERLWGDRGRAIQARRISGTSITTDGNGGVITVVWYNPTIQMINRNGEIGAVLPNSVNDRDIEMLIPNFPNITAYPNPFNSHLQINFSLPVTGLTSLKVFDISGREVETLMNSDLKPGYYSEAWDAKNIPSGIYLLKLQAGERTRIRKVVLTR